MFGIGMPELVIIFVLALLVFGPKELPKVGKTIGKVMAEFRRASDDLKDGIQREIDQADREEEERKTAAVTSESAPATIATEAPTAAPAPEPQLELPMAEPFPAPQESAIAAETASGAGESGFPPPAAESPTAVAREAASASEPQSTTPDAPPASPDSPPSAPAAPTRPVETRNA